MSGERERGKVKVQVTHEGTRKGRTNSGGNVSRKEGTERMAGRRRRATYCIALTVMLQQ